MKSFRNFLAIAAALVLAALAPTMAAAHGGDGVVTPGAVSSISTTQVSAFAGNGGSSTQVAHANGMAAIGGVAAGSAIGVGPLKSGMAGVSGEVVTTSTSIGAGMVTGNATGAHSAANLSQGALSAAGQFHTVANGPEGKVTGNAEGVSGTSVTGTGTGIGAVSGGTGSQFASQANASQIKVGSFNTVKTDATSAVGATAGKTFQFTAGNTTVASDFQAAANAFGQAKVGAVSTTTSN